MKITSSSNHWSWTLEETWWLLNFNKLQWLLSGLLAPWQSWHLLFMLWPQHNVFKVNGTTFTNYTIPLANEAIITGNDVITLATLGRKLYICGVNDHCANYGQRSLSSLYWKSRRLLHRPPPTPQHQHPTLLMGSLGPGINFWWQPWLLLPS